MRTPPTSSATSMKSASASPIDGSPAGKPPETSTEKTHNGVLIT